MAKIKLDKEIESIEVPWSTSSEMYKGSRVEEFIKKQFKSKAGYLSRTTDKETDGNYHLRGFADEERYNEWNSNPEAFATNVLFDIALPSGDGSSSATSYILNLVNGSERTIITTSRKLSVKLRFTSQVFNPATQQTTDTGEMGVLTIQTKVEGASNWSTKGTVKIESYPADSSDWVEVPIGDYLTLGQQSVRIICRGETTELSTTYVSYSITVTSLALDFAATWENPFDGERIPLSYYVTGNIAKDLTVRVTGKDYDRTFTRALGTNVYTETPYILEIDSPKKHGVYTVTAYLSSGSSVQTDDLVSQIMVAEEGETGILMALNGIQRDLTNWNTVKFFEWAVYNPSAETTPVQFRLMDDKLQEAYLTQDIPAAANRTRYELSAMVEVETEEGAGDTLNGRMLFYSGDTELRQQLLFTIDNSENFSPTKGADFVLNPKQRTNTEENPMRIVNQETGEEVPSVWKGFELLTDGWQTDSAGAKCLRVLAGCSLDIDYESYSETTGQTQESSLTIEIDYASRNATDLAEPIIRMCSTYASDGLPLGLEIRPQEAYFLTTGHRTPTDQDVMFQEDTRTHLAVNIIYNLGGHGISYVRLFINGIINREFVYTETDKFIQRVNGVLTSHGIRIGSETSDVDIYGIRIYKKALSATDIRQDYMASMTEVSEKIAFRDKNDVLYNNLINYERASQKYNTMLWTGSLPYILDQAKKKGDLTINIVGDPSHSGTIKGMSVKGQGSSSKKYFLWNHQYGFGDYNWIDGNGTDRGAAYQLTDDVPPATKLVAKLNWASSQQSHKAGSCDLYHELWKEVVGGNSITETGGYEKCRVCVKQLPFMMFVRENESAEPVFYGLVTFGPGKGDKPTFGYDKEVFPDYLMIEGSDNGAVLTLHQVPWNEDVEPSIDDEGELEGWKYNGVVSWDFDLGNEKQVGYFQTAHNFIYQCSNRLKAFVGTLAELQAAGADLEKDKMYWVTKAGGDAQQYDLYRYDWLTSTWVDAGVNKSGVGSYEKLNLRTQLNDYLAGFDESEAVQNQIWEEVNAMFINARVAMFKSGIGQYYNLSDARFTMMMMKLIAASDNRAKNTYQYLDPKTHLICFAQDDMDTIFLTDNLGRKDKPYYVEEHDLNANGKNYWNGEVNTFYNLMELAFPAELRSTMKAIFSAMAKIGGFPMGCFEKFYFRIQKYFPAVAYNETARLLYEYAEQKANEGLYNPPSVSAISQSLGDQLQGEMQYLKMRTVYLSSFCSYGDFSVASSQSISFRSRYTKDGKQPTYTFNLRPFMWIYPAVAIGQSLGFGADNDGKAHGLPQRVKAGENYTISFITDNDTPCALLAPDCYSSIGNWGDKPLTGEFALSGKRLTEFSAGREEGIDVVEFNSSSFKINTPNLKRLNLNGVEALSGILDLSRLTRAKSLGVAGTALSTVTLPKTGSLEVLELPAKLTTLRIDSQPGLKTLEIEGVGNLQTVFVDQAKAGEFNSRIFAAQLYTGVDKELNSVTFRNIKWESVTADMLMFLHGKRAELTGTIAMMVASSDRYITFDEKMKLVGFYGDIDSTDNSLYISYSLRSINSIAAQGENYIYTLGYYDGFSLSVLPTSGNNVKIVDGHAAVNWSIDKAANVYAEFIDPVNGVLNVKKLSDPALKERFTITVEITTMDDKVMKHTKQVGFFNRIPEIGDFAYADGTFDDAYDPSKTLAGVVFMRTKKSDTEYELRIDAAEDIIMVDENTNVVSWPWGLYPEASATNGFPQEIEDAIQNAAGIASATDTAMPNINSTGLSQTTDPNNGKPSSNYINEDNYLDDDTDDGYAVLTSGSVNDFDGKEKTDIIIEHCNHILLNYLDVPLPETMEELYKAMKELAASNSGAKKYWQFYYPAAYMCRLYEPKAEAVHEQYRSGNWYLPANGELARIYNFHNCSRGFKINTTPTADYADEHPSSEARMPLFANMLKRVRDVNAGANPFALHSASWYWSSTEGSRGGSWYVGFSSGYTYTNNKYNGYRVRAVAAFTFKL